MAEQRPKTGPEIRLSRMQREDELSARYRLLARQEQVLRVLALARESLWESDDDELARFGSFQTAVARRIYLTCVQIWELSGPGEAADDGLPF